MRYKDLPGMRDLTQMEMEQDLKAGERVRVGLRWTDAEKLAQGGGNQGAVNLARDGYHSLTVERFEGDKVILRNPWGMADINQGGDAVAARTLKDHQGTVEMSREEFFSRLNSYNRTEGGIGDTLYSGTKNFVSNVGSGLSRLFGR